MLPLLLAQVSNPPIIRIPPTPPPKWYDTGGFGTSCGLCALFLGLGASMTHRIVLAHGFFVVAWAFGLWSLWILCGGVFPRKKMLAWILLSVVLGILIAAVDFYCAHGTAL
jgi:hypothetical protein